MELEGLMPEDVAGLLHHVKREEWTLSAPKAEEC